MAKGQHKIVGKVHPGRVVIPALIGIAVGVFIILREETPPSLLDFEFSWWAIMWLFLAVLMLVCREIGYILRLYYLSDKKLSLFQCLRITLLWEFASSVTPSAIGGTSVALLFLYKEGLSIGRGSAVVLATFFLDELYFIIMFPIILWLGGWVGLFQLGGESTTSVLHNKYFYFAMAGYALKLVIISLVGYGLFINPRAIKKLLLTLFKLSMLRKWRDKAKDAGDEIIRASEELSHRPLKFWIKNFIFTFFSWTSRYWVANFLILALLAGTNENIEQLLLSMHDHAHIFARQLVMWIMTMVAPTPGGAGFSEVIFLEYMNIFIPKGFASLMSIVWRFVSYYPFLFIGAIILPVWIRRSFKREKHTH